MHPFASTRLAWTRSALSSSLVCFSLIFGFPLAALGDSGGRTVVVTATRVPQSLDRIGSAVSVISAEDIERHQDRRVVDALKRVPGISVRTDGGRPGARPSIFVRGTDSDQTLILVNGMRLHDPSAPNKEAFLDHLPTEDIERIEVLRGPQSTLYGSQAIGGVINIVTKQGGASPVFGASFEGGSYATYTHTASVRGSLGPANFSVSGTRIDSDGISAQRGDSERDGYEDSSVSVRGGVPPTAVGEIGMLGIDVFAQYIAADIDLDAGSDLRRSDTESQQILFSTEPSLSLFDGIWQQKLRYSVNDARRDNDGVSFALPSDFESRLYELDWQNEIVPLPFLTFLGGIEYEAERAVFEPSPSERFTARTHSMAYFLEAQLALWERLFLTAGGRLDDDNRFRAQGTYRFTGAFKIPETATTLRASVGNGFKAPSLADSFDARFGSNNPNLDPEESLGFDVGVDQSFFEDRLSLSLGYFYNDIEDMIVTVPIAPFTFRAENIEAVVTQGLEASLVARPHRMLDFQVNYTYTDTEAQAAASFGIRKGGSLLRRPKHEFNVDLTGRLCDDRLRLTIDVLYVGERNDLDPNTGATVNADDYAVVNLKGSFQVVEGVEVFARIENLFDEDYEDVLGFNTPGISGYGGVRLRLP